VPRPAFVVRETAEAVKTGGEFVAEALAQAEIVRFTVPTFGPLYYEATAALTAGDIATDQLEDLLGQPVLVRRVDGTSVVGALVRMEPEWVTVYSEMGSAIIVHRLRVDSMASIGQASLKNDRAL
jgi:hypothetical protein